MRSIKSGVSNLQSTTEASMRFYYCLGTDNVSRISTRGAARQDSTRGTLGISAGIDRTDIV